MPQIIPGQRIGDLLIEQEIGRGAFATVYRARDTLIDRPVALKVLHGGDSPSSKKHTELMLREARLMGGLVSPHIVTLYRVHALDEHTYMFEMELIDGETLEDRLSRGPPPTMEEVEHTIRGILSGLQVAHEHSVIHRDIKPANVLVGTGGSVKLADFGVGRLVSGASFSSKSGASVAGTPAYMAPELFSGGKASYASDIWSAGILLYRLLTTRMPFVARNFSELFVALTTKDPLPLPDSVPAHLARACLQCLQREPAARPADVAQVLENLTGGAVPATAPEPARAPVPKPAEEPRPVLAGRAAELEIVEAALSDLESGQGGVLLLSGGIGVGKSVLLSETVARARIRGMRAVECNLSPVGGLRAALLQGLRRFLGDELGSGEIAAALSKEQVGGASPLLRQMFADEGPDDAQDRQRFVWAIEKLLRSLSKESRVAIVFDDMHLAQVEDVGLLLDLVRQLADAHVLFVVALRSLELESSREMEAGLLEALHDLHGHPGARHIEVGPLGPETIYELLEREAGGQAIEAEIADVVVRKAEGNPLYALEVFREIRSGNGTLGQSGAATHVTGFDGGTLPRRFQNLFSRRLAGLSDDDRLLVDTAAVDGVEFDGQALAAVLQLPLLTVLQSLQRLHRQHGLVRPHPSGFRFAHVLYRDVVYETIAPELRREMHRLLAEHLETRTEGDPVSPERLGDHWEQAGQFDRARPYLMRAARRAARQQCHLRALGFAARAGVEDQELKPVFVQENAELLLTLVGIYHLLGRTEVADRVLHQLEAVAQTLGDEKLRLCCVVARNDLAYARGGVAALDLEDLEEAATSLPVCKERGMAYHCLARAAFRARGDAAAAQDLMERADAIYTELGLMDMHSRALDYRATLAKNLGQLEKAEALYVEAARVATEQGRLTNAAISETNCAISRFERGKVMDLEDPLRRSVRVFALAGLEEQAAFANVMLAKLHYATSRTEDSTRDLAEALRLLGDESRPHTRMFALHARIQLLFVEGHLDEALAAVGELRDLGEATGYLATRLRSRAYQAKLHAVGGRLEEAGRFAREALELARSEADVESNLELIECLSVAVLLGLPADVCPALRELVPADGDHDSALVMNALCHVEAASLLFGPGPDGAALGRLATSLMKASLGDRRDERHAIGQWLLAESHHLQGDKEAALREATGAAQRARRLGHVWLELVVLKRLLASENPVALERYEELLDHVSGSLDDASDAERLRRHWALIA